MQIVSPLTVRSWNGTLTATVTLDWYHLIALLGAIQGVLLAAVLAARVRNRTANRLLAGLVLAFSIHLVSAVYYAAGLVASFPHFFGISYPLHFVYGPLVYLYAATASDRSRRLRRTDALHFLPLVVVVLAALKPIYFLSASEKVALFQRLQQGDQPLFIRITDPLRFVSGIGYAVATLLLLRRHHEQLKESYSSLERVNLRWLIWLGAGVAGIWLMALGFQLLESAGIVRIERQDDYISLAIAAMVYTVGYMGLRQPEIFRFQTAEHPISVAPLQPVGPEEASAPRYERSGLGEREASQLKNALTELMDRTQPWKNSELTLADLAGQLATTPHKLSEVLNTELQLTFYDFVNGYRVREVQRRIEAGDSNRLTILALATDAGFASKSTFNLVFKRQTGRTPSEYRQAIGVGSQA